MDPILNCLTSTCCPPESDEQKAVAAKFFTEYAGCADPAMAKACGEAMLKYFDLAEKGTLTAFKESIKRLHKG